MVQACGMPWKGWGNIGEGTKRRKKRVGHVCFCFCLFVFCLCHENKFFFDPRSPSHIRGFTRVKKGFSFTNSIQLFLLRSAALHNCFNVFLITGSENQLAILTKLLAIGRITYPPFIVQKHRPFWVQVWTLVLEYATGKGVRGQPRFTRG